MAGVFVSVEDLRRQLGREVFVLSREVFIGAVVGYLVDLATGLARAVVESLAGVLVGRVGLPQVGLAKAASLQVDLVREDLLWVDLVRENLLRVDLVREDLLRVDLVREDLLQRLPGVLLASHQSLVEIAGHGLGLGRQGDLPGELLPPGQNGTKYKHDGLRKEVADKLT